MPPSTPPHAPLRVFDPAGDPPPPEPPLELDLAPGRYSLELLAALPASAAPGTSYFTLGGAYLAVRRADPGVTPCGIVPGPWASPSRRA